MPPAARGRLQRSSWATIRCGIERELEQLRSSDGLYTAPQIKALAGDSLADTAYANAALKRLGDRPRLTRAAIRGLRPGLDDDAAWRAWYRVLLARAGTPVDPPSHRAVLRLWRAAHLRAPATDASALAALTEVSHAVGLRATDLPARGPRAVRQVLSGGRGERSAALQLQRAFLLRFIGEGPDEAVRAAAARPARTDGAPEDRSAEASAVVELRALLGMPVTPAQVRAAAREAQRARTPQTAYWAARAVAAARAPRADLQPLRRQLRELTGSDGTVPEQAVFPAIPKAVWLVAHIRREAGAPPLPEDAEVRLSRAVPRAARGEQRDPDNLGLLLAAAKLAGLEYQGTDIGSAPTAARVISSSRGAIIWAQRAAVAGDLGIRGEVVRVKHLSVRGEPELGAAGAVLATARDTHARLHLPPGWTVRFRQQAAQQRFQTARATMQTSAGLVAIGDRRTANRIVQRYGHLGCPGFRVLASDRSHECDLESALLLLRMRDAVPAAKPFTRRMLSTRD
ncbi:MAG: hypothetical protein LC685_05650 [Actinobacteria bacterium]|nr:hypothetical protein [Actinomycetota bacterium]